MSDIKIIKGEIFMDERGQISSLNNFHFDGVKRCYMIHHPNTEIVRGWHGHKDESKWFYCVKGQFSVACVKVDNWTDPSPDLIPQVYHLNENESNLVCVPKGYANCLKAWQKDSVMLVFSEKILEDALGDSWRYDKSMWIDWSNHIPDSLQNSNRNTK